MPQLWPLMQSYAFSMNVFEDLVHAVKENGELPRAETIPSKLSDTVRVEVQWPVMQCWLWTCLVLGCGASHPTLSGCEFLVPTAQTAD